MTPLTSARESGSTIARVCRGLWFDMLDKEGLVRIEGWATDIASGQVGGKYRDLRRVEYPHCRVELPRTNL